VESLIGRIEDASSMLASFRSLPHRLSRVPAAGATRWINDSIATTPHATLAALQAVGPHPILIVGGQERGADWEEVAAHCRRRPLSGLVALPDNGERIARRLLDARAVDPRRFERADDVEAAVDAALELCEHDGGTVLLSPGAPSFPHYRDFEERGTRFEQAVRRRMGAA
ncbi:MAG: glutamate ligase domain-containing protein, partial [Candidatus Wenzhouxiangella sp. M2_3B_020]